MSYVFALFDSNPLKQLVFLSPLLGLDGVLLIIANMFLRRQVKAYRRLLGQYILVTLAAYTVFIVMMLLLNITGTSYGLAQPVIIVFGGLYLFSLAVGLLVVLPLYRFKWVKRHRSVPLGLYMSGHLGVLLLMFYGFYVEPFWIETTYTTVPQATLAPGTPPIKIVLISDIHMEHWTRREEEALTKINALEADLIMISGDHINLDFFTPQAYADLKRFFSGLKAKYGVFAVGGTVDYIEDTYKVVEGTAVQLLNDEITTLTIHGQKLEIVGIKSDYIGDEEKLYHLSQSLSPSALKIFLYHTPDLAPEAAKVGINLYLAGHTHGGQLALPFYGAIFTASHYGRNYAAGLYPLGGKEQTQMYVTRGLGFEGNNTPRARLFARPEISVITLKPTGGL